MAKDGLGGSPRVNDTGRWREREIVRAKVGGARWLSLSRKRRIATCTKGLAGKAADRERASCARGRGREESLRAKVIVEGPAIHGERAKGGSREVMRLCIYPGLTYDRPSVTS